MTDCNDLVPAHNDQVPAQEKLEWVTPKISLMEAEDTDGIGKPPFLSETIMPDGMGGVFRLAILDPVCHKPRHTNKNQ
jgi:hypothetical protein